MVQTSWRAIYNVNKIYKCIYLLTQQSHFWKLIQPCIYKVIQRSTICSSKNVETNQMSMNMGTG